MKFLSALALLTASASAFTPAALAPRTGSTQLNNAAFTDAEKQVILDKVAKIFEDTPSQTFTPYVGNIQKTFPGAMDNLSLENKVVSILAGKGFTADNTLLATSLCCDELARRLEDDFNKIYGNNFNLGGLSGFPFAGNTGFGAMAAHIPDNGSCLIVYGPHVGISKSGEVGKVERVGIELVDNCCGSAIAASNYLKGITDGGATISTAIQEFTDFQQGAVQELILPHGKRLSDAGENRMKELPYALYDSQDQLMLDIVKKGAGGGKKNGFAVLGGIQINTAPDTLDYFHPLRFDLMNTKGEVVEDMLPMLTNPDYEGIRIQAITTESFQPKMPVSVKPAVPTETLGSNKFFKGQVPQRLTVTAKDDDDDDVEL